MSNNKTLEMIDKIDSPSDQQPKETTPWWIKMFIQPALLLATGVLLIVGLGAAQKLGWISAGGGPTVAIAQGNVEQIHTCSMDPQIRQPHPGRCPICGMELVVAASGGGNSDEMAVYIEPAARRVANIRTAEVKAVPLKRKIRTIGSIAYNEGTQATIASYFEGRIERLMADYTGVVVEIGDPLAVIYSPELYMAQVEFIQAKKAVESSSKTTLASVRETQQVLFQGSRSKLAELGMTVQQIRQLEQTGEALRRISISAPIGGTVIEKLAVEGQYIKTGDPIYRIADLSTVWLMLELFPKDVSNIRYGQRVEAELDSVPGRKFRGRVEFIDPILDPKTRTVGVRVVVLNDQGLLRPGDFATAHIAVDVTPSSVGPRPPIYDPDLAGKWIGPRHPHIVKDAPGKCEVCGFDLVPSSQFGFSDAPVTQAEVLVVPRDALLMAGGNSVVYVETEPGRFEIRPVVLGPMAGNQVVIVQGLEQGEEVATSGNFLIDSQMQLEGKPSVIDPRRAIVKQAEKAKQPKPKPEPLKLEKIEVAPIAGSAGSGLEDLYQAYFAIQASLAGDKAIPESQSKALASRAQSLLQTGLPDDLKAMVQVIGENAASLHEKEIKEARVDFKPISKAVIQLASRARGVKATGTFIHFYCPMVKGGEGDWLQPSKPLLNPYWGSKMLHCGEIVRQLPTAGASAEQTKEQPEVTNELPPPEYLHEDPATTDEEADHAATLKRER